MRASVVLIAALGCGPAVGSEDAGSDGAGGSGEEMEASSGEASEDDPDLAGCAMPLDHGAVNRAQVASSLAAMLCIAQEACCIDARPSDSCRHARNMGFERLDAEASEMGLTYDAACAGYQLAMVDALGCDASLPSGFAQLGACSIYYGDAGMGDACESVGTLGSTCAQGLACYEGRCVDPCTAESFGRPYVYGYACGGGEVVVGDRCEAAAYRGAQCSGNCAEGLRCGDEQTCEFAGGPGDSCSTDGDCRDVGCIEEVCAAGQSEGMPCGAGCGLGLQCDAGLCAPEPYVCAGLQG